MRQLTTDCLEDCHYIKELVDAKSGLKDIPVTRLVEAFVEKNEAHCNTIYKVNLVIEIGYSTLM